MARGTLTITSVTGSGPYTVTVSSAAGVAADDHLGARITNLSGPGGVWLVTGVSGNDITVSDTLTEENGGAFGAPVAGSYAAWFGTPTARGLSRPPHLGVGWDACQRRNAFLMKGMAVQEANAVAITGGTITGITDLAVADGGTGASTAAGARTNLGLVIGTNVQAWAATLDDVAGLTPADGAFIVGDGTDFVTESGATARTSLGLGTIATQNSNNVTITGGSVTGITDLAVADGGTGASTASGARTNLGLVIGTDVQAFDTQLASLASLSYTGNGDKVVAVKPAEDGFELQTVATLENLGYSETQSGTGVSETATIPANTLNEDGDAVTFYGFGQAGSTGTVLALTVAGNSVGAVNGVGDANTDFWIMGTIVRTGSTTGRLSYAANSTAGGGIFELGHDNAYSLTGCDWTTDETIVLNANDGQVNVLVVQTVASAIGGAGETFSDWADTTIDGAFDTNVAYTAESRMEGDSIHVRGAINFSGAPNTVSAYLNLPSGFTANEDKMSYHTGASKLVGRCTYIDQSALSHNGSGIIYWNTTNDHLTLFFTVQVTQASPITWANGDTLYFDFLVPVE